MGFRGKLAEGKIKPPIEIPLHIGRSWPFVGKRPGPMDEDRNELRKWSFQGQALCRSDSGPKDKSLKLEPLRFVVGSQENKKHSAILH